jgi:hypothetical protein
MGLLGGAVQQAHAARSCTSLLASVTVPSLVSPSSLQASFVAPIRSPLSAAGYSAPSQPHLPPRCAAPARRLAPWLLRVHSLLAALGMHVHRIAVPPVPIRLALVSRQDRPIHIPIHDRSRDRRRGSWGCDKWCRGRGSHCECSWRRPPCSLAMTIGSAVGSGVATSTTPSRSWRRTQTLPLPSIASCTQAAPLRATS